MSERAAMLMFGLAVLWLVYQFALRQTKCGYCGGVMKHEEHCPYNGTGLTGGHR